MFLLPQFLENAFNDNSLYPLGNTLTNCFSSTLFCCCHACFFVSFYLLHHLALSLTVDMILNLANLNHTNVIFMSAVPRGGKTQNTASKHLRTTPHIG